MINSAHSPFRPGRLVSRDTYLTLVRNALDVHEFRFARLAALNWLSSYSGDLAMRMLYCRALTGEERLESAYHALLGLTLADPEYLEAYQARLQVELLLHNNPAQSKGRRARGDATVDAESMADTLGCLVTLSRSERAIEMNFPVQAGEWCQDLRGVRKLLNQTAKAPQDTDSLLEQAEESLLAVIGKKPTLPLVAVTHLQLQRLMVTQGLAPSLALRTLAEHYQKQFPECIPVSLILAESLVDSGEPQRAVSLLHQAAANDVSGQVVRRLWGREHPYRNLWPETLEAPLDMAIPAPVAATLGHNQLPEAGFSPVNAPPATSIPETEAAGNQPAEQTTPAGMPEDDHNLGKPAEETAAPAPVDTAGSEEYVLDLQDIQLEADSSTVAPDEQEGSSPDLGVPGKQEPSPPGVLPVALAEVQRDLEKLARRLRRPELAQRDGRFPVYVVMTSRTRLEAVYGVQAADQLEGELLGLVQAFEGDKQWHALLFYADRSEALPDQKLSLPAPRGKPNDPTRLRQALLDLDAALKKQGRMIGAVLIAGGAEVVPFHQLSNPVDDEDLFIPSDNPYGTNGENLLAPQWPVGRLPGSNAHEDEHGEALARQVRAVARWRRAANRSVSQRWYQAWLNSLVTRLNAHRNGNGKVHYTQTSFGYTAALWRFASFAVFTVIGDPKLMRISPALPEALLHKVTAGKSRVAQRSKKRGNPASKATTTSQEQASSRPYVPAARLGYFNLHGTADDPEWFGNSDPTEEGFENAAVEFPIALKPQDIGAQGQAAPQIVFSEACFGASFQGKTAETAMCLSFLEKGCHAFVGSTCVAYGSLDSDLTAADYLSFAFWRQIRAGYPAGEALRLARLDLQDAMLDQEEGLDAACQKTLASFILLGDPLALPEGIARRSKAIMRPVKEPQAVHAMCDNAYQNLDKEAIPAQTLSVVRKIVDKFVPEMRDAQISVRAENEAGCHVCANCLVGKKPARVQPASKPRHKGKRGAKTSPRHQLVILSKAAAKQGHTRYARLTMDERGRLLRLVVSR